MLPASDSAPRPAEREETLRLEERGGGLATQTRSVTVNYLRAMWRPDRLLDRHVNEKPEDPALAGIPGGRGRVERSIPVIGNLQ